MSNSEQVAVGAELNRLNATIGRILDELADLLPRRRELKERLARLRHEPPDASDGSAPERPAEPG